MRKAALPSTDARQLRFLCTRSRQRWKLPDADPPAASRRRHFGNCGSPRIAASDGVNCEGSERRCRKFSSLKESHRCAVRLQMAAEFAVADDLDFREIHDRRLIIVTYRWQMIPAGVAAPLIVPAPPILRI